MSDYDHHDDHHHHAAYLTTFPKAPILRTVLRSASSFSFKYLFSP